MDINTENSMFFVLHVVASDVAYLSVDMGSLILMLSYKVLHSSFQFVIEIGKK